MVSFRGRLLRKKKRYNVPLPVVVLAVRRREDGVSINVHVNRSDPRLEFCVLDCVIRGEGLPQDDGTILAESLELVTSAPFPDAVHFALDKIQSQDLPLSVLNNFVSFEDVQHIQSLKFRERRLAVARIVRFLKGEEVEKYHRQRIPRISHKELDRLEGVYRKGETGESGWSIFLPLKSQIPIDYQIQAGDLPLNLPDGDNPESPASPLGSGRARVDYIHGKKQPQVRWMVNRIRRLRQLPSHVLDVGGGRGDLATSIALAFEGALVTVVDKNKSSLDAGRLYAQKLGIGDRMNFVCADFFEFTQDRDRYLSPEILPVDLVVALHACGDLSDLALVYAEKLSSSFVICPCCYVKRYIHSFVPVWYSMVESENDLNTVRKLAELNERLDVSKRAMTIVNSLRLSTFTSSEAMALRLEEYENSCSLRNMVLVGEHK